MFNITKHSSFTDMEAFALNLGDAALQKRADELREMVDHSAVGEGLSPLPSRAAAEGRPYEDHALALHLKKAWSELYGAEVSLWPQNLQDSLATIEAGVGFGNFGQNITAAFQNLRLEDITVPALEAGMAVVAPFMGPDSPMNRATTTGFIPDSAARAGLSFISSPFTLVAPIWFGGAFGRVATAGVTRASGLLGIAEEAAYAIATSVGVTVESAGFVATNRVVARFIGPNVIGQNDGPMNGATTFLQETLSATFIFGGLRVFGWMGGLAQTLLPATETGVAVAKLVGHATSVTGLATMEEIEPSVVARFIGQNNGPMNGATTFYEKLWRALFLHTTINSVNGFMNFNGAGNEYGHIRTRANDIKRLIEAGLLPQNTAVTTEGLQIKIPIRAEFSTSDELRFWNEGSKIMFPFFTHATNEPVTMAIIGGIEKAVSGRCMEELKILEIGSHDQSLTPILEQRFPGIKVIQSDFAKAGYDVKGSFIRADASALPIQDGALDLGISSFVAEYVGGSFAEMYRVLRPGGHAVMVVHSKGSDIVNAVLGAGKEAQENLKRWGDDGWKVETLISPAFRLGLAERIEKAAFASEGDLRTVLEAEGFEIVSIKTLKNRGLAVVAKKPSGFLTDIRNGKTARFIPLDGVIIDFNSGTNIIGIALDIPKGIDPKDPSKFGDWLHQVAAAYDELSRAVSYDEPALGNPFLMPTMSARAKEATLDYLRGLRAETDRILADALQELEAGQLNEFKERGFARSGRLKAISDTNEKLQPLGPFDRELQGLRHSQQTYLLALGRNFNETLQQAQRGEELERWRIIPRGSVESRLSAVAFAVPSYELKRARHELRLETVLEVSPALKGLTLDDPIRRVLEKVAETLLSNAAKYSDPGKPKPTIWIKAGMNEGQELVLEVTDNGIGMSPEELAHVGEHGWRSDAVKEKIGGEGVGIATLRARLSEVGGRLNVSSVKGEGTTWTAYIPLQTKTNGTARDGKSTLATIKPRCAGCGGGGGKESGDISFVGEIKGVAEDLLVEGAGRLKTALAKIPSPHSDGVAASVAEVITARVNSPGLLDHERPGVFWAHIETKASVIETMAFLLRLIEPPAATLKLLLSARGPLYVASNALQRLLFAPGQFTKKPAKGEAFRIDELFTEEVIRTWLNGRDLQSVASIGTARLFQLARVSNKFDMQVVKTDNPLELAKLIWEKFVPASGRVMGGVTAEELEREVILSMPLGTRIEPESPVGRFLDRMKCGETATSVENNVVYGMLEDLSVLRWLSPAVKELYHRLATEKDVLTTRFAIGGKWPEAVVDAELHELALFTEEGTMYSKEAIESVIKLLGLLGRYKALELDKASPGYNFGLEKANLFLPLIEWAQRGYLLPVTYTVEEATGKGPGIPVAYARLDGLMERLEPLLKENGHNDIIVGLPPIDELNVNLGAFQAAVDDIVTRTGFRGRLLVLDIKNMIAYLKAETGPKEPPPKPSGPGSGGPDFGINTVGMLNLELVGKWFARAAARVFGKVETISPVQPVAERPIATANLPPVTAVVGSGPTTIAPSEIASSPVDVSLQTTANDPPIKDVDRVVMDIVEGAERDMAEFRRWMGNSSERIARHEGFEEIGQTFKDWAAFLEGIATTKLNAIRDVIGQANEELQKRYFRIRESRHFLLNRIGHLASSAEFFADQFKKAGGDVTKMLSGIGSLFDLMVVLDGIISTDISKEAQQYLGKINDEPLFQIFINMGSNAASAAEARDGFRLNIEMANPDELAKMSCPRKVPQKFFDAVRKDTQNWDVFSVNDNGAGIPEDVATKLFDQIVHGDTSRKGSGEGLFNAKRIVQGMGGELGFVTKLGEGTTFYIFLPKPPATEQAKPGPATIAPPKIAPARVERPAERPVAPAPTERPNLLRRIVRGLLDHFGIVNEAEIRTNLISATEMRINAAKAVGATPVALFDIDGTVKNARKHARRVLKAALDAYPGGLPFKQEILFNDADLPETIDKILEFDETKIKGWWDAEEYLKIMLGNRVAKRYPQLYEFVTAYFKEHFFKLSGWEIDDAIGSTIDIISDLRSKGARIVFVSLRGTSDDIDPSTGESHTVKMLKAFGAWENGDELVLKDGGTSILSSISKTRDEKSKLEMVLSHFAGNITKIADPAIVAIVDNDPHQLRLYFERFKQALYVHVKGDLPPGASEEFPSDMSVIPLNPRPFEDHPNNPGTTFRFKIPKAQLFPFRMNTIGQYRYKTLGQAAAEKGFNPATNALWPTDAPSLAEQQAWFSTYSRWLGRPSEEIVEEIIKLPGSQPLMVAAEISTLAHRVEEVDAASNLLWAILTVNSRFIDSANDKTRAMAREQLLPVVFRNQALFDIYLKDRVFPKKPLTQAAAQLAKEGELKVAEVEPNFSLEGLKGLAQLPFAVSCFKALGKHWLIREDEQKAPFLAEKGQVVFRYYPTEDVFAGFSIVNSTIVLNKKGVTLSAGEGFIHKKGWREFSEAFERAVQATSARIVAGQLSYNRRYETNRIGLVFIPWATFEQMALPSATLALPKVSEELSKPPALSLEQMRKTGSPFAPPKERFDLALSYLIFPSALQGLDVRIEDGSSPYRNGDELHKPETFQIISWNEPPPEPPITEQNRTEQVGQLPAIVAPSEIAPSEIAPSSVVKSLPSKALPGPDKLQDAGINLQLGGASTKHDLVDGTGRMYLFKHGSPARVAVQQAVADLSSLIVPKGEFVPVRQITFNGQLGSLQPRLDGESIPWKFTVERLTRDQKRDIAREAVIDWVFANHDSDRRNLLILSNGRIVGVDKERAFEFPIREVEHRPLDINFETQFIGKTFYMLVYRAYSKGLLDMNLNDILPYIQRIEHISDIQWIGILMPFIDEVAEERIWDENTRQIFINDVLKRKHSLREDFRRLFTQFDNKPFVFADEVSKKPRSKGTAAEPGHEVDPLTGMDDVARYAEDIRALEREMFVEFWGDDMPIDGKGPYVYFPPSYYFRRGGLFSREIVSEFATHKDKKLLSVGVGAAYLERLLVQLGLEPGQIVLADRDTIDLPDGFKTFVFDMFPAWPDVGMFDTIIFPESIVLNECEAKDISDGRLVNVISNAMAHLNPGGEIRIQQILPRAYINGLEERLSRQTGLKIELSLPNETDERLRDPEEYPFASAVISIKRDAKHGNQEGPKGPATADTPVRPNVLQRMLKGIRDFFGMVEETTHLTEAARYVLAPQLLTMNFAVQPGKGEVGGDDHLGFKRPGTGPMRVLTSPQIEGIHNDISKLRALGGKRALADGLFANGKSLMESSWMKAEGEKYINEAVALFDELGLAESAGDGLFELCKYYGADMRNRSGTLWPALKGAAERYEKAAVEAATPKDKARAKEKARQAWIRYARFHRVLGDQKEGNKTKRGPASQDDYRTAAEAYGRAGDTEARDHMAMKQGSVSLDQAGKLMAAMDAEDYRDGNVDLSQLLGYCRSARDGFLVASASKDPAVASKARRDLEGTVRLSAAVWTNVLDNNRPHISSGLAAVSNPSADAKVQTIRPDYGALKVYPKAIAGLGADIAEAEGLGMMGLKRQAEKTRSAAIAEYVKLTKAVVARAMRGRAHRISARFYKHAARMYRNLGMEAKALAVEAELAGLNEAYRDRGGRQPAVEPQGVVSVAEFLKLAEREKNPPRKFELLKRAAEQSERNGDLIQAIEIYGRLAAITDYRNLSHSTRVETFENIARLSEKNGDPAGYRDACVKTGDAYERWKDAHRNFNVPEKMEKAAEWYMRGKAYDRAVSALLQKAEALFPDGLAAAYKIAVATETLRSFRKNVTSEEIFQTCMKALNTLRSTLDIAKNKLRDPQRAGEVGQKFIVRLRELNAMSFDTIAKFKDMAEKIADGRTAHVNPKEGRHVIYLQAVDGVRFVSGLAKALGVEGKLPYDPAEKYKKERPTAERLKAKLDHGSADTQ